MAEFLKSNTNGAEYGRNFGRADTEKVEGDALINFKRFDLIR